eukprot:703369-Pelagomonas_calceolata.AAC.6
MQSIPFMPFCSLTVELEHPTLDALALGSYRISLTVETFLGQTSVADHVLEKQASGITPSATITTPSKAFLSDGLTLDGKVSTSSVCEGSEEQQSLLLLFGHLCKQAAHLHPNEHTSGLTQDHPYHLHLTTVCLDMPLSICSFQTSQAAYQWSCEKIVRGGVESSCSLLGGEDEGASLSTMISNEDLLSAGILSGDAVTFTLTSRFVDGDKSSQDSLVGC